MFTQKERVELAEVCDLSANLAVGEALPRWQRKALAAQNQSACTEAGSTGSAPSKGETQGDRFIPSRSGTNYGAAEYSMENGCAASAAAGALAAGMLDASASDARVLAFKDKAPTPSAGYSQSLKVLYTANRAAPAAAVSSRHIPSAPEKILDAPGLRDEFYANVLDWSPSNVLAVGLGQSVYLWNAGSGDINELCTAPGDDVITSVAWVKEAGASYLAVGTSGADVQVWDAARMAQVRSMRGHEAQVGALAWNGHTLASGTASGATWLHDVRVREHHAATLCHHTADVCGLAWSHDGSMLASGANDNTVGIWDAATASGHSVAPKSVLTGHTAAVKALAWCPWQRGVLATGGGTADRTIKFWNASSGALINSADTGSQVVSLLWSPTDRELLSAHGYSRNHLALWKFPSMTCLKELTGHTARVLGLSAAPDGVTVASAGADETLRFWRVFSRAAKKTAQAEAPGPAPATLAGVAARTLR